MQSFLSAQEDAISKSGTGQDAITNWCGDEATEKTQLGVLEYCRNDCRCLGYLYERFFKSDSIKRTTKSGKTQVWNHGGGVETVQVCLEKYLADPSIDTHWLRNPPDPAEKIAWVAKTC